jgi:hypothetical protein
MEPSEYRSVTAIEVLTTSLAMRLTPDELEGLWRELSRRTAEKRPEASESGERGRSNCRESHSSEGAGSHI